MPRRLSPSPRLIVAVLTTVLATLLVTGCATESTASGDSPGYALPPAGAPADYQLGGAYAPAPEVGIVARDRTASPADGVYSICYVNGFQTQPGERDAWPEDLLLHDGGDIVFDPNWPDEALLDTTSPQNRSAIADIVGPWIDGCADAGFAAVEFDNLDTYARSGGALTFDDNLALASVLVDIAHDAGLAAGQKNAAEDSAVLHEQAGFDFAISEECAAFRECEVYTEVYGDHVIDIEYSDDDRRSFAEVCADAGTPASTVLRDRDLTMPDDGAYVFELCDR